MEERSPEIIEDDDGRSFQIVTLTGPTGETKVAIFEDGGILINAGMLEDKVVLVELTAEKAQQLFEKWYLLKTYQKEFARVTLSA